MVYDKLFICILSYIFFIVFILLFDRVNIERVAINYKASSSSELIAKPLIAFLLLETTIYKFKAIAYFMSLNNCVVWS